MERFVIGREITIKLRRRKEETAEKGKRLYMKEREEPKYRPSGLATDGEERIKRGKKRFAVHEKNKKKYDRKRIKRENK